ncbi:hypothetical protein N476_06645 [Pseudoalteromonas luteoviolacea H33]|uniref:Uncharacterized protein n=1 Tax=Pseudoalteromonas luteoviolacea H33 TaxID=1365251 RepID=A0A167GQS1_9GAMM|nr:hypothetical protein N476_06645 [Pseudoalteromonas luteoviolacea H33]KZN77006.1 hypothetical protein N477_13595 [Pseudoalteromonas luteoviolacea H33-S]
MVLTEGVNGEAAVMQNSLHCTNFDRQKGCEDTVIWAHKRRIKYALS